MIQLPNVILIFAFGLVLQFSGMILQYWLLLTQPDMTGTTCYLLLGNIMQQISSRRSWSNVDYILLLVFMMFEKWGNHHILVGQQSNAHPILAVVNTAKNQGIHYCGVSK